MPSDLPHSSPLRARGSAPVAAETGFVPLLKANASGPLAPAALAALAAPKSDAGGPKSDAGGPESNTGGFVPIHSLSHSPAAPVAPLRSKLATPPNELCGGPLAVLAAPKSLHAAIPAQGADASGPAEPFTAPGSDAGGSVVPSVSLQRDGDRVTHIRIQCGCGQLIELECAY